MHLYNLNSLEILTILIFGVWDSKSNFYTDIKLIEEKIFYNEGDGYYVAKNIKNGNKKSSVNDAFEGAKAALPIFIDEYTKECDRKNVIESKITTLLTIEIAVLTVFIPIIPFENIKTLLADNCNSIIIAATISCALLVISIVMMAISFGILMSAVSIQTYSKVDIEKLDLEENLRQDANSVEKGLCDHYKIITLENSDINDRKARKYQLCLPIIIISFFLMTLGTILLKVL